MAQASKQAFDWRNAELCVKEFVYARKVVGLGPADGTDITHEVPFNGLDPKDGQAYVGMPWHNMQACKALAIPRSHAAVTPASEDPQQVSIPPLACAPRLPVQWPLLDTDVVNTVLCCVPRHLRPDRVTHSTRTRTHSWLVLRPGHAPLACLLLAQWLTAHTRMYPWPFGVVRAGPAVADDPNGAKEDGRFQQPVQ